MEKKEKKKKEKKEKEVPVPSAQELKTKGKLPRRSPAARPVDAIRVSAKDGESYADILKAMEAKVNPQNAGAEVLSIRTTRREEILLVLKQGGDVSNVESAMHRVGQARPRGPVHAVHTLWRCADCGGPFNRGGGSELPGAR